MSFYPSEKSKGLDSLNDATITSPKNHEVLMHNGTEWENSDVLKEYELVESDNLLENHAVSTTIAGITYTVLGDGSVDVDGTLTATVSRLYLTSYNEYGRLPIPDGTYKMVGTPSTITGTATAYLNFWNCNGDGQNHIENGSGLEITYAGSYTSDLCIVVLGEVGDTISHALFKPMITKNLNATYADFVPFYKALKDSKLDIADEQILGAWNLLENKATTHVENGITFTVGNKKEVRVTTGSTAPSSATNCDIQRVTGNIFENLEVGKTYYLTGCPAGGSNSTYCMIMNHRDTASGTITYLNDTGNGLEFVYDGTWTSYQIAVQIWPAVGANFNKTFYPMISVKKDMPYVPYAPANKDCMSYAVNTKLGAHNLLQNHLTTQIVNGITATVASDGVVNLNGTLTSSYAVIPISRYTDHGNLPIMNGMYTLTGHPKTYTGTADLALRFYNPNGDEANHDDRGDGTTVNYVHGSNYNVAIIVQGGVGKTITNAAVKPMLRTVEDTDTTFTPYAMTNGELTEVKEITVTGTNTTSNATFSSNSRAFKVGKVVQCNFIFTLTTDITEGGTITFNLSNVPLPKTIAHICGFASGVAYIAQLSTSGVLNIRLIGGNAANGAVVYIGGTYIAE